jgi:hypothetical protein
MTVETKVSSLASALIGLPSVLTVMEAWGSRGDKLLSTPFPQDPQTQIRTSQPANRSATLNWILALLRRVAYARQAHITIKMTRMVKTKIIMKKTIKQRSDQPKRRPFGGLRGGISVCKRGGWKGGGASALIELRKHVIELSLFRPSNGGQKWRPSELATTPNSCYFIIENTYLT